MPPLPRLIHAVLAFGLVASAQAQPAATGAALERAKKAKTVTDVLSALGVAAPEAGKRVLLEVPDIAIAGSDFDVKVSSQLPGTDWVLVLSERDPLPFVKLQEFTPGVDRSLSVKLKLAQTGRIRAIVRSSGKYYQVSREVKIATPAGASR